MMYDFGIFGGDDRQIYIGKQLKKAGYKILYYGVCKEEEEVEGDTASSFFDLLEQAEVLLGPIPLTKDQKQVYHQGQQKELSLKLLESSLEKGKLLIAGCIPESYNQKNWLIYDYMKDEALTIFNSIATAEGSIVRAIEASTGNLSASNCLILGYGVCAKTLASRLMGLKAKVCICARKEEARAMAKAEGLEAVSFEELDDQISRADYLFNTVPALVVGREELKKVKKEAVIIDIASAPGGIDFEWASGLGIYARLCPGLPGIYAPEASAKAMTEVIQKIWMQRNASMEGSIESQAIEYQGV